MKAFESEAGLVERFLALFQSGDHPWGSGWSVSTEFDYRRGRTDVVAVDSGGTVLAFEAKLSRWKDALHQAYRNTSFAHRSYVLLPESAVPAAHRYALQFKRRGVGLCSIGPNGVTVVEEPPGTEPLQPVLSRAAAAAARAG